MINAELHHLFNVPFTFSRWCRSGLLVSCGCSRCMRSRGETPTAETEALAEQRAREADEIHDAKMREFFASRKVK